MDRMEATAVRAVQLIVVCLMALLGGVISLVETAVLVILVIIIKDALKDVRQIV